ncbi:MAG TPA: hypothetical protein VGI10_27900 [Polyangiaceae bacterium]
MDGAMLGKSPLKPSETPTRSEAELTTAEHGAPATVDQFECDQCAGRFDGPPHGSGLFLWTRGDEYRVEEPPLCEACALKISIGAVIKWEAEDEEE